MAEYDHIKPNNDYLGIKQGYSLIMLIICPDCKTSFFITKEHIDAAQTEVKCGQCGECFNPKEHIKHDATEEEIQAALSETIAEVYPTDPHSMGNQSQELLSKAQQTNFFSFDLTASLNSSSVGSILHPRDYLSPERNTSSQKDLDKFKDGKIASKFIDPLDATPMPEIPPVQDEEVPLAKITETLMQPKISTNPTKKIEIKQTQVNTSSSLHKAEPSIQFFLGEEENQEQPKKELIGVREREAIETEKITNITLPVEPITSSWATYASLTCVICLLLQIGYFVTYILLNSNPSAIQTISSSAMLQNNRLLINIDAKQKNTQAPTAALHLTLQDKNMNIVVNKTIQPEEYLKYTTLSNNQMHIELSLAMTQPIHVNRHKISWQQ